MRGSWRPNRTATYWPPSYGHSSVSFPFSWLLNRGPSLSGTCSSFQHLLSNWSDLQTDWTSCALSYIIVQPPLFLWASLISLIQPVHGQDYILIFLDRMHLLFTQVHFLFWQLGRVRGQYTTQIFSSRLWVSRANYTLLPWYVDQSRRRKTLNSDQLYFCF